MALTRSLALIGADPKNVHLRPRRVPADPSPAQALKFRECLIRMRAFANALAAYAGVVRALELDPQNPQKASDVRAFSRRLNGLINEGHHAAP